MAHPDDESFGLGALLSTFVDQGATVSVLCFTRGEASTLHGVDADLAQVRAAADELDIGHVELRNHPDGALSGVDLTTLVDDVTSSIRAVDADGIIAGGGTESERPRPGRQTRALAGFVPRSVYLPGDQSCADSPAPLARWAGSGSGSRRLFLHQL